jgi:N utilization substance protein B
MSPRDGHLARSAARLAAVQALFQMELAEQDEDSAIRDFLDTRLGAEIDGVQYPEADPRMFERIVRGAVAHQVAIDGAVDTCLPPDWPLHRLDSIMRAILRAGGFELIGQKDVPARVVLNEYTSVARAFFDGPETGMINGILDRFARVVRADEFTPKAADGGAA